ncbi:MAG: TetR/AcrR family transcriptional regulator [Phaeobacter gallaeciensis]
MTVVSFIFDGYVRNENVARKNVLKASLEDLTPKARQTRTALIQAGKALIGREGVASVNVMTLCAEANVGRTSFYNYFDDVDVLTATVAIEAAADIKARFDHQHAQRPRGRERLRRCLAMILSLADSDPDMVMLLTSLAQTQPGIGELIEAEIVTELRAEPPDNGSDTELLARYLTVATMALVRQLASGALPLDGINQYLTYLMKACD